MIRFLYLYVFSKVNTSGTDLVNTRRKPIFKTLFTHIVKWQYGFPHLRRAFQPISIHAGRSTLVDKDRLS